MLNLTADPQQVKHLLITARDELQARGWCKGDYGTIDGPKCTLGAIAWADHGDVIPLSTIDSAKPEIDAAYVMGRVMGHVWMVPTWNDQVCRSPEEAIAAFNAGIGLVDEEIARRAQAADAAVAQVLAIAEAAGVAAVVEGSRP